MTLVAPRLAASLRRRLRTSLGKRFSRFVPVAVASFGASQVMLTLLLGPGHATAGISAIAAWLTGAAVSYILSRWAWERKGKPHVLKETLPFWAVSVGAWIVLGVVSHYASVWAVSMGLGHWQRVAVVNAAYLLANCVTFVTRFAIFHYVLFADRGSMGSPGGGSEAAAFMAAEGEPVTLAVPGDGSAGGPGRDAKPGAGLADGRARR